jgi:hypothetical protein
VHTYAHSTHHYIGGATKYTYDAKMKGDTFFSAKDPVWILSKWAAIPLPLPQQSLRLLSLLTDSRDAAWPATLEVVAEVEVAGCKGKRVAAIAATGTDTDADAAMPAGGPTGGGGPPMSERGGPRAPGQQGNGGPGVLEDIVGPEGVLLPSVVEAVSATAAKGLTAFITGSGETAVDVSAMGWAMEAGAMIPGSCSLELTGGMTDCPAVGSALRSFGRSDWDEDAVVVPLPWMKGDPEIDARRGPDAACTLSWTDIWWKLLTHCRVSNFTKMNGPTTSEEREWNAKITKPNMTEHTSM